MARTAATGDTGGGAGAEPFDPGQHTVAEVVAYVAGHPEERDRIYAAEEAGKARTTLLEVLA